MNNPINVYIADDHKVFRNGLIASLEPYPGIKIIGEAESGEALLELITIMKVLPDVIIIDMKMRRMDGIETTRIIKQAHPNVKVIGLSVFENHHYIVNMFKAGANGYLLKDSSPDEIVLAIKTVVEEDYYFNQMVSAKFLKTIIDTEHFHVVKKNNLNFELNETDLVLLKLICSEFTNAQIADKMNLGTKTIENYRNKLLAKTGAKNTAGLVMYAIKKGHMVV